jgi:hypothetical protein
MWHMFVSAPLADYDSRQAAAAAGVHNVYCAGQHHQGLAGTAGSGEQQQPATTADGNRHQIWTWLDKLQ